MEGSPLNQAYTASMEADSCALNGDFKAAKKLYTEAADAFDAVLKTCPQTPSARTLRALSKQHRDRAEQMGSLSISKQTLRYPRASNTPPVTPPRSTEYAGNNAEPAIAPRNEQDISAYTEHAVKRLFKAATVAFVRGYEHSLTSNEPTESFYLAATPQSGRGNTNIHGNNFAGYGDEFMSAPRSNNSFNRAEALENAIKAMDVVVKGGLHTIIDEISRKEQLIYETHTSTVDRIRAENDQLNLEVKKLQERWDNLKESAKKKRDQQLRASSAQN